MNLSYSTLFRGFMFSLGIGAAGLINNLFGTESTVLILGGLCGLLLANAGSRQEHGMLKQVAVKMLSNLKLLEKSKELDKMICKYYRLIMNDEAE